MNSEISALRIENRNLREGLALALKWAESGIADLLPETAKDKFCDDWQKLEAMNRREKTHQQNNMTENQQTKAGLPGDLLDGVVRHCVDALKRIAALAHVTEVRGGMEDIDAPDHKVKEGGWVPIHPRLKLGLELTAKMAQEALDSLPNASVTLAAENARLQKRFDDVQLELLRVDAEKARLREQVKGLEYVLEQNLVSVDSRKEQI